jgi:aminoglycoside 6'-N-acetyltransferase I
MLMRQAHSDDIEGLRSISVASGREIWGLETLQTSLQRFVVVAESEGHLVGAAKTHFHAHSDGEAPAGHYLGGVMVDPSYRCQGIASALTRARLDWIWSQADHAYYFANEQNTASIRLHAKFGFCALGSFSTVHGVTADNGQSKLILFKARR